MFAGQTLARTKDLSGNKLPPGDVQTRWLRPNGRFSLCEYKGQAQYFDLQVGDRRSPAAAWRYPQPEPAFAPIRGYYSFYASRLEACYVAGEKVQAQAGDLPLLCGWINSWVRGPFKGGPGTFGW